MSTVPAACVGEVAVMEVAEFTVKEAAGVVPKETAVVPVKPLPVSVTTVPPAVLPELGLTAVIAGTAARVYV
jgi:hypothetical protein